MKNIFKNKKPLIGMIHLPPLLSFDGYPGIDNCISKALRDLETLEDAGFDAVLIENDDDKPSTEFANSAQIASFAIIAKEVAKQAKIPLGIQIMLNDWKASIEIASLIDASFIRIDVFVDRVTSKWGNIIVSPAEIISYKTRMYPELLLFTDIQVKHKTMLIQKSLSQSAQEAIQNSSNALIVSGNFTGQETPLEKIKEAKSSAGSFPVFVGAGVSKDNIVAQLNVADGVIIGTSIKSGEFINADKAKELVDLARSIK